MDLLVTTHVVPWPAVSGASHRMSGTIEALAELGDVDVICVVEPGTVAPGAAVETGPARSLVVVERPAQRRGVAARTRWLAGTSLPWKLHRDPRPVVEASRPTWERGHDLAWLGRAEGFVAFADHLQGSLVCDLDDLEDVKAARDRDVGRDPLRRAQARIDRRRWQRLQRRVVDHCDATVVCSEVDRRRLGSQGVTVVPNVYPDPGPPAASPPHPPTVTFVGLLTYAPNVDAACHLVDDVAPRLRRLVPQAEVRLVGRHDRRTRHLAERPGVTLTGFVDHLGPELARADVAVVPIRQAGGTRVKVLEAFAHRIPVVSTTVGCEGLDVEHGRHLLVADGAEELARACARVLDEPDLGPRLAAAAHDLWRTRYRPEAMRAAVRATVSAAVERHGSR